MDRIREQDDRIGITFRERYKYISSREIHEIMEVGILLARMLDDEENYSEDGENKERSRELNIPARQTKETINLLRMMMVEGELDDKYENYKNTEMFKQFVELGLVNVVEMNEEEKEEEEQLIEKQYVEDMAKEQKKIDTQKSTQIKEMEEYLENLEQCSNKLKILILKINKDNLEEYEEIKMKKMITDYRIGSAMVAINEILNIFKVEEQDEEEKGDITEAIEMEKKIIEKVMKRSLEQKEKEIEIKEQIEREVDEEYKDIHEDKEDKEEYERKKEIEKRRRIRKVQKLEEKQEEDRRKEWNEKTKREKYDWQKSQGEKISKQIQRKIRELEGIMKKEGMKCDELEEIERMIKEKEGELRKKRKIKEEEQEKKIAYEQAGEDHRGKEQEEELSD